MIRIGQREIDAVARVINGGKLFRYTFSADIPSETQVFEREWAEKMGTKYCLSVSSGTAALISALAGCGIGPGDEVILPGYTFISSANAILAVGAIPVLADIDDAMMLDPKSVESLIGPRTKAIMPVHMLGIPADMDGIMDVANRHNLLVIEDACQADGASYKGRRLGSIGTAGCYSFNYFKIMTCGEGGAFVTNDYDLYSKASMMHDGGIAFWPHPGKETSPIFIGLEFRMNNILAAILREQAEQLDGWIYDGRAIKARITEELKGTITPIPSHDTDGECGISLGFRYDTEEEAVAVMEALAAANVSHMRPFDTDRHVYANWEPIINHRVMHCNALNPFNNPANAECRTEYTADMLPHTLDLMKRTLFLNLNPYMGEEAIVKIITTLKATK
ncbi:MAG: DegT/DnrJ/EryC1/StrS family aminotransferase [bacterium]